MLIFDDAESWDTVEPFLRGAIKGHALLTTRDNKFPDNIESIPLEVFDLEDIEYYVTQKDKRKGFTFEEEKESIKKLAERLGYFPLAIVQAISYIIQNHTHYIDYINLLRKHAKKLFDDNQPIDYQYTVLKTWEISISKLSKAAKQLLNLCAYLNSNGIVKDIYMNGKEQLPEPIKGKMEIDVDCNSIFSELLRYSLLDKEDIGIFSMHRLVQEVTRQKIGDDRTFLLTDFQLINSAIPDEYSTKEHFAQFEMLSTHAKFTYRYAVKEFSSDTGTKEMVMLSNLRHAYQKLGHGFYYIADYNSAVEAHERQLQIDLEFFGEEDKSVATAYNDISNAFWGSGKLHEASVWCKKSIVVWEKLPESYAKSLANAYNTMGLIYANLGDGKKSLEWFAKSSAINEKIIDSAKKQCQDSKQIDAEKGEPDEFLSFVDKLIGHRNVADVEELELRRAKDYNNQGLAHARNGDYTEALTFYKKALEIRERILGTENRDVAQSYSNIASAYNGIGSFCANTALEWAQKALAIQEKILPDNSPDIARSCTIIGLSLLNLGQSDDALYYIHRDVEICEKTFPDPHPDLAIAYNNMATIYHRLALWGNDKKENYLKALEWYKKAYEISETINGSDHPNTAVCMWNIGGICFGLDDINAANEWIIPAFLIAKRKLGMDHDLTQRIIGDLRNNYEESDEDLDGFDEWLSKFG